MNTPRNILVRGVNWLGDALMATPALTRLRESNPQARITLLTHAKLAALWPHHPALDATLTFSPESSVSTPAPRVGDVRGVKSTRY